jgi:hypothetical protein
LVCVDESVTMNERKNNWLQNVISVPSAFKFPTTIFNGVRPPWQIPSHIMTSPPPNGSVSEKQPPVKWSPVPLYTHVCDVSVGDEPYSPVLDHSELITFGSEAEQAYSSVKVVIFLPCSIDHLPDLFYVTWKNHQPFLDLNIFYW